MQFIYDNLIASVISMTVLLILFSIQAGATQSNIARTSRNVAKGQAQDFITWLEEDLAKMGKNMTGSATGYETPDDTSQWHTREFVFSFINSSGDTVRTKYDLKQTEIRMVDSTEQKIFKVDRFRKVVNSGSGWSRKGQSPSSLGYFEVDILNNDADSAGTATQAEFIKVQFSIIAPFQGESTFLRRVHRSTVVPYRLAE